ncbi:hypothetical protein AXF42_Ash015961 [Apostasia shenzhenica]|uniref:Heptahelical transmembrane protein 4 n=1 Tax=Apostasia shenzhenica TaxID=1088818 RepID=A0A2I0AWH3_9ASPA|nr:hypothetical protein AXF42_Ash015961 [Apostasia shenzhenica]
MCYTASLTMASSTVKLENSPAMQFLISSREPLTKTHNSISSPELTDYDSLPEFLKHNEFILSYYRSEWPLRKTILSIFSLHNETVNVWTHLIGFIIFFLLSLYAASISPLGTTNSSSTHFAASNSSTYYSFVPANRTVIETEPETLPPAITRWPFYVYLAGAMFCLLMSSACHLLSCHSARTCYLMFRLDYAGISALIVSSFYPLVYYSFTCNPFFRQLYLSSITVFGSAAVAVSLVPVFDTPQFRPFRAVLFACMGASGVVPIGHKMMAFGHRPEAVLTTGYEAVMLTFYGIGVMVYATRVPERWLPGKFDLAGHSHQLFHVLVVAGAYTHYLASLVYLGWREAEGC